MLLTIINRTLRERFGERKSLEIIKETGFNGVDYSFDYDYYDENEYCLADEYIEKAKETKKLLKEFGLNCYQSHAPFRLKYGEGFTLSNKNYRDIVRSMEYASLLDCKYIVVHAVNCPDDVDTVKYNIDLYNSLLPFAKKFGIVICIENLYKSLNTIEKHKKVYEALDKKYFAICVDVGHCVRLHYSPDEYINSFEKGQIACVHLQDIDGVNDNHWLPYQGVIDWDKTLKALKDYGFNGAINLEAIHCFDKIENDLMYDAFVYAGKIGKYMVDKYEKL